MFQDVYNQVTERSEQAGIRSLWQKKKMKLLFLLPLFLIIPFSFTYSQSALQSNNKLNIRFDKNVELLGFAYFLAFESEGIETKVLVIDGEEIPKKVWHSYGYAFFNKYKSFRASKNLSEALSIADHLWLDYIINLLLRLEEFPNAVLPPDINPALYIRFSKTQNQEEARANVEQFLAKLNAFCKEVDFDTYLKNHSRYYDKAMEEIQRNLQKGNFIQEMEAFFQKTFQQYSLIPSLTLPKGMGFGLKSDMSKIYNVFGAVDWQRFEAPNEWQLGFNHPQKIRELSIHEFGHSFINPIVDGLPPALFDETSSLFEPIKAAMNNQGYNTWKVSVYEHFVRASELLIAEEHASKEEVAAMRKGYIEERQFIYIPHIQKVLKNYQLSGLSLAETIKQAMINLKALAASGIGNNADLKDACEIQWHTEDVERFWKVYDQLTPKHQGNAWQKQYIDKGSLGLTAFLKNRIENGKRLAKTIRKNRSYYENIRSNSLNLEKQKKAVCRIFEKLDSVYPEAVFPAIYFVVGRRNTGGTIFKGGLIIGIERFGESSESFNPDIPIENLDDLIAHELIHFQQDYVPNNTLLAQCIREGAADFIGELLSGSHINKETYKFGDANETLLKEEFRQKMLTNNWSGWLYYRKDKSRPKDLGYWIGYKICKSYYDQVKDKRQAIHDILNIKDFEQFLRDSQYMNYN